MSKCIYIAGPMNGVENYEDAFFDAQKQLEKLGWLVENPVTLSELVRNRFKDVYRNGEVPYKRFFEADVSTLMTCDAIYMLNHWELSRGARAEHSIAIALNLKIYYQNEVKSYRYD